MTMSQNILFTFQSGVDLNDLWESIAMPRDIYGSAGSDNLSAAEKFADKFEQLCGLLSEHPEIGLERDDLHAGVRSVLFHRYVVFYRSRGDSVEVLRVMSATRDVTPGVPA
jgi:plasmid stabilization system protein ParE